MENTPTPKKDTPFSLSILWERIKGEMPKFWKRMLTFMASLMVAGAVLMAYNEASPLAAWLLWIAHRSLECGLFGIFLSKLTTKNSPEVIENR